MSTNLTQAELTQREALIQAEIEARIGTEPTIERLQAQGYTGANGWTTVTLERIGGAGRVLTLLVAEFAQAFAAPALAIVFILLEAERIASGAQALGQAPTQAGLIAAAFTVANAVLPLYRLRNVKDKAALTRKRGTLRGWIGAFMRRIFFKPQTYQVDVYDNPTLGLMEKAITGATLFMAFYAVLGPMLGRYSGETWFSALVSLIRESNLNQMIELIGGALLSIGGVFGVQSISWEFGVRVIVDRPQQLTGILEAKQAEHQAAALAIREQLTAQFDANIEAERRRAERKAKRAGEGVTAVTTDVTPVTTKRDRARQLLAENPDYHGLSLRQLEEMTGIDRQSWSVVKGQNGNGRHES